MAELCLCCCQVCDGCDCGDIGQIIGIFLCFTCIQDCCNSCECHNNPNKDYSAVSKEPPQYRMSREIELVF